jgi:hypothetical protein
LALLRYNLENNSLDILQRFRRSSSSLLAREAVHGYRYLENDGRVVGLRIENALSHFELIGAKGEDEFAAFLDANQIPAYRLDQSWEGVGRTVHLSKRLRARRPDFLMRIGPEKNAYVDVKSHKKAKLTEGGPEFDLVFDEEIDELVNFENAFGTEVWVCFHDSLSRRLEHRFSLASVGAIASFRAKLRERFPPLAHLTPVLRLPESVMHSFSTVVSGDSKVALVNDDAVEKIGTQTIALLAFVRAEILRHLSAFPTMRSDIGRVISNAIELVYCREVDAIVADLIGQGQVGFEPRKPLRVL